MAKRLVKILTMGVALIVCLGLFVGCGNSKGKIIKEGSFYSMQAAFDDGLLSKTNLKNIKNYKTSNNIEDIDELVIKEVKMSYLEAFPQNGRTVNDVIIGKYYGEYNGCIALMIDYTNISYTEALWSETISGVKFNYNNGQRILIFKLQTK